MRLENGSRVLIVGGGPSGSFTALNLLYYASEVGLNVDVTILEPRDFNQLGPGSCNKCAGILSANLMKNLNSIGLQIPQEVIQSEIINYILHINQADLAIHRPDSSHSILSVYRGSGPRMGEDYKIHSFDGWLLEQAHKAGAKIQRGRVQAIKPGEKPMVIMPRQQLSADLVVLATGVNTRHPLDNRWEYRPPNTETMAQDEVYLPETFSSDSVHVFFDHPAGLIFGALIPKGRYANISLLGHKMPQNAVDEFLVGQGLMKHFPNEKPGLCGCTPRVTVSMASNFFADRLAVVGDAAVTRLYKDGIGAAFLTAQAAARTAIYQGVSRADFEKGYLPLCQQIDEDNRYGRMLFRLWSFSRRSTFLMNAWQRAIQYEDSLAPSNQVHTRVLWGMFTGSESFRQLFWLSLSRKAFLGLLKGAWLNWRNL